MALSHELYALWEGIHRIHQRYVSLADATYSLQSEDVGGDGRGR